MTRRPLRIPSLPIGLALFVLFLAAPQLSAQTITSLNPPSVAAGGPAFTLTVNGANFAANALVQVNGVSRATVFLSANQLQTTILASDIATPGALAITVFLPAGPVSNTVNLLVTALPPPALTSVAPGISAQGAAGLRLTLIGSNFRAGATVVISPPLPSLLQSNAATQAGDISIDSVSVLNSNIIVAVVSVSPGALLGLRAVDVRNLDGTSTIATPGFNVGTTQPLQVVAGNSLGAPLSITTLSILHPRNGTLVMQGDDLFGEATLAGTGSGSVVGAWLWDGNITEQFAAVFAGGQSVTIRSRHPFPTSFLGSHTVELRILQPNQLLSRPVTVVVNPGTWQLQRLLSPPYGAGIKMNLLPRLRWTPVPGAAKYQVGFSARPYLSTITEWHDATDNEWVVPQNVWEHLPQGDLYWSVRTVEMSGETRKPVPMRLLRRFPENALAATAERPRLTSAGNPLLEWEGLQGHYVYRITISSDPQGSKPLRRYLTADPRVDLRALSGKWDPAKTYYWRVDAVTPEGRTILTGPTHMFEPPAPPASRSSRAEQPGVPGFVLAAYRTGGPERDFSRPAEPLPADLGPQIVNRTPAADSTLSDPKGLLKIEFKTAVNAFDLALMVDDTDVTSMAQVSEATVSYTPAIPLSDGEHKVNVTLGPDTASWKFTVKAGAQVAAENMGTSTGGTPVQSGTDAEAPPAQTPAEIKAAATAAQQGEAQQGPTMEMQSQLSANTNWVSGSAADMNALTFGQQLIFRENGWTVQMNGSGLLNSTLAPDAMRTSLGRVGDYVMQTGLQRGNWGFNLRFGIVAPALYLNSQFITTAVPRQGVETQLKTPGGTFGFYANTNDLAPGGGSGLAFHQQILGASWDLPLPKQRVELRLMWLGSQESGESSMSSALTAGGGDLYGALLQVHLSQSWLWNSEYAWGYNTLDLAGSPQHTFGRAWRSGIAGSLGRAMLNFGYFDVGENFSSPANPMLSAMSNPGRRGITATAALPTGAGTFSLGYSFLESNVGSASSPAIRMNGLMESWSRALGPKTTLTLAAHETLTTTGNVPAAVLLLPPDQQAALEADQRDLGSNLTVARQVGRWTLSLGGARDWFRNNLMTGADTITSSVLMGASLNAASFFQLNTNFSVNWISAEKSTIGGTRTLSGYLQPVFLWQKTHLQVQPVISYNQTRTELLTGILTNNLTTTQYGGRISWTMPGDLKFSTLSFQGNTTQSKDVISNTNIRDEVLALVWTVVWA